VTVCGRGSACQYCHVTIYSGGWLEQLSTEAAVWLMTDSEALGFLAIVAALVALALSYA
jgi:ferredoxin